MHIRNPRTGENDYRLDVDSSTEVEEFAVELRKNQSSWNAAGIDFRVNVLQELASEMERNRKEIISHLAVDTGRRKISEIELDGSVGVIRGRCLSAPRLITPAAERKSFTRESVNIRQQLIPYHLVGVISPWNFPLLLGLIDAVPALLAGSAVLLKTSEVTPRFIDPLEKIISAIPPLSAVFKLVRGGAITGQAIVENVDALCFTGSVTTGRAIGSRCAERFIPAFLELGGKDPAIILEDADVEVAADAVLRSGAGATGQACQSLERIYVHRAIYSEFLDVLVKKCEEVSLNHDYEEGGTMGPLIFQHQAKKIASQLEKAVEQGAEVLCGGEIENHHGGLWMRPTVVVNVTHAMELMSAETFGPVIPVMAFSSEKEAIQLANESEFGLSASVFSKDIAHAIWVAEQVEAGGISINDGSLTNQVYDATKNSFKLSGINGSRMGDDGFLRFLRKKALLIQTEYPMTIFTQSEKGQKEV